MQKKVFISFTSADRKLAEKLRSFILKQFDGDISVYLSSTDMQGGQLWKEEIKKNLQTSDAIISLITPKSLHKPWIYIEWAAFWMAGLTFYILKTEDVPENDVINPMRDRNYATINDYDSFKGFLKNLTAELLGEDYIAPLDKLRTFIEVLNKILAEMADDDVRDLINSLEKDITNLPGDNKLKAQMALKLAQTNRPDLLKNVFSRIDEDAIRVDLFNDILKVDKTMAVTLIADVESNVLKAKIVNSLLDIHREDKDTIESVIKSIDSDVGLRRIGDYMISQELEETDLFRFVIENFKYNTVLKRWGSYFIEKDNDEGRSFKYVVKKLIENHTKLAKDLALELISAGRYHNPCLGMIITGLIEKNKVESVQELLEALKVANRDSYLHFAKLSIPNANSKITVVVMLLEFLKRGQDQAVEGILETIKSVDPDLYAILLQEIKRESLGDANSDEL